MKLLFIFLQKEKKSSDLAFITLKNIKLHVNFQLNKIVKFNNSVEMSWFFFVLLNINEKCFKCILN